MSESFKTKYPILSAYGTPVALKQLPQNRIADLTSEIRSYLVDVVSHNGGHLASNLGVVELTVAIHRVFGCPRDHIIFDVGHQSYVHKLLTGRAEAFDTLRQAGGISGFTKRAESEYDCFGAGHSSTSLSAAIGFAASDRICGKDAYTVAVIGDGAFTGGMIHEALNNCPKDLRLVIIINENEMSISRNTGRFAKSLSHLRLKAGYLKTKDKTGKFLQSIPLVGDGMYRFARGGKDVVKRAVYGGNYFENLGLYYLGTVDGNDEEEVERALREAKKLGKSVVVHVKTTKGKGYAPAEKAPDYFHALPKATAVSQDANTIPVTREDSFSARMGKSLVSLSDADARICAVSAAMTDATGLRPFRQKRPERFFDVGIAEEHAVTFCAGLSANGMLPVFAVYSSFLQRSYDQVLHDAAMQKLGMVLCIDRAGLNSGDGVTHHGIFDVAMLSEIPNVRIYTPVTYAGLELSLRSALSMPGEVSAIRYPNGQESEQIKAAFYADGGITGIGVRTYRDTKTADAVIVTHGQIAKEALAAVSELADCGIHAAIVLCEFIKPYPALAKLIFPLLGDKEQTVVFLEEEIRAGGFGMMLKDALDELGALKQKTSRILAVGDTFVVPTAGESLYRAAGVDKDSIVSCIRACVEKNG